MQSRHCNFEDMVSESGECMGKNDAPICYENLVEVGFPRG